MRIILIFLIITIQFGCSRKNLVTEEISEIRTICIENFADGYDVFDKKSVNVVDFQLEDSINISTWKNHMFNIKWLDTMVEFNRADYLDMINDEDIITFRDNEFQIPNKPSYIKFNETQHHRENYNSTDTLGFLRIMPIIFDSKKETSILFLRFHRGYEESVTCAFFLKLINLK